MPESKKVKSKVKDFNVNKIISFLEKCLRKNPFISVKKIILSILILCFLYVSFLALVSHGEMDLSVNEAKNITFTSMWKNFLKGRYDVDPGAILEEAHIRDGKAYTYYGIFPMLPRGLIDLLVKKEGRDWARLLITIAAIITVLSSTIAFYMIASKHTVSRFGKYYYTVLFGITLSFGSMLTVLLSSGFIYHEVIMWGMAWACVFILLLVKFFFSDEVSPRLLFLMSVVCGFGMHTRGTTALGPLLVFTALMIVVGFTALLSLNIGNAEFQKIVKSFLSTIRWSKKDMTKKQAISAFLAGSLPLTLMFVFHLKINYERWGDPFIFIPTKYYGLLMDNEGRKVSLNKAGNVNFDRLPHEFAYYFIPSKSHHFIRDFPYAVLSRDHELFYKFKPAHFDYIEPGNPLSINSLYLIVSVLIGLFALFKIYGVFGFILTLLFCVSNYVILTWYFLSWRYGGDLLPTLVLLALPSYVVINFFENKIPKIRFILRTIFLVIALLSIFWATASMCWLKMFLYSVPQHARDSVAEYYRFGEKVTNGSYFRGLFYSFSGQKGLYVPRFDGNKYFPLNPFAGQLWSPDSDETIFWFDGRNWILIKDDNGMYYGPITMKVRFNPRPGAVEPLVTTGVPGFGDFVAVIFKEDNKIQIAFDHWGSPGKGSDYFKIDPGHEYLVEISLGSFYPANNLGELSSKIFVKLDGKLVLNKFADFHPAKLENIKIGRNEMGGSCGPLFTGQILEARRVGVKIINQ